ncbi:hypothetical protein HPB48_021011 [Haemaphysalis longicornis]|uniref:Uncharacterized protein n=1 Tax=Haemaphysalis longicornis TaxID=44386 RepID=A0A9J6GUT8_HAELO|nr:hypothetical protein HPB48_021011 [Haemaphysalis longicornis]
MKWPQGGGGRLVCLIIDKIQELVELAGKVRWLDFFMTGLFGLFWAARIALSSSSNAVGGTSMFEKACARDSIVGGGMDAGGGAHGAFKKSAGVKLLLWACRAEGSRDPQVRLSPEDEAKRAAEAVHEEDVPRRLCIVNGLVLLVVAGLINGYYA